jgi:hypothetical protein
MYAFFCLAFPCLILPSLGAPCVAVHPHPMVVVMEINFEALYWYFLSYLVSLCYILPRCRSVPTISFTVDVLLLSVEHFLTCSTLAHVPFSFLTMDKRQSEPNGVDPSTVV